jgi:hypothetical protein
MAHAVTRIQLRSAGLVPGAACHFSPQFSGGLTFFRPVDAPAMRRNSSIEGMEITA